jgi:hypothetical protein
MTRALRWAEPVLAVTALLLAGAGPSEAVGRAGRSSTAPALTSHLISGTETSISCLTMARCVAVGAGPRGGQVVVLWNGRQTRVTVLRWRAALTSVSCPSKAGCWALGPTGTAGQTTGVILVEIGPTGNVVKTIKVAAAGDALTWISCRSMTACQIQGLSTVGPYEDAPGLFFSPWNGKRWRLDSFILGGPNSRVTGLSCWQTTCVLVGWSRSNSTQGGPFAWTFHNGVAGAFQYELGSTTTYSAVYCVSASTCYAAGRNSGGPIAFTISDGVPSQTYEPMPFVAGQIACVRSTCWATRRNQIVMLRGGVVHGTPVVDSVATNLTCITAHGDGFIDVGGTVEHGKSDVVIG